MLRTPYDNLREADLRDRIRPIEFARRGYAVADQDTRGRHDSPGEWHPFIDEARDGHDTIEWVAKQPWSNGKVGLIGSSYRGLTIWQTAQGGSPHLIAATPRVAYSNTFHHYDRNPNTGHTFGHDAELQVAHQTVYHDGEHPSHILLPVVP